MTIDGAIAKCLDVLRTSGEAMSRREIENAVGVGVSAHWPTIRDALAKHPSVLLGGEKRGRTYAWCGQGPIVNVPEAPPSPTCSCESRLAHIENAVASLPARIVNELDERGWTVAAPGGVL